MNEHIEKTIEHALSELRKQEDAAISTKRLINQLCAFSGKEPMFADASLQPSNMAGVVTVQKNSFYGRALATCIREYLDSRKVTCAVKEATLDEIMGALEDGTFDFEKITSNADDRKRSVAINLSKNPAFHRLPSGDWGLQDWYDTKQRKARTSKSSENGSSDEKEEAQSVAAEGAEHQATPDASTGKKE